MLWGISSRLYLRVISNLTYTKPSSKENPNFQWKATLAVLMLGEVVVKVGYLQEADQYHNSITLADSNQQQTQSEPT